MRDISEPKASVGAKRKKPLRVAKGLNININLLNRMDWLKKKTGTSLADIHNEALELYLNSEGVPEDVEAKPVVRKGVEL